MIALEMAIVICGDCGDTMVGCDDRPGDPRPINPDEHWGFSESEWP